MTSLSVASERVDRFGSIEAIALDCVARHNEASAKVENYTLRLAASVMVLFHDKGADKTAGNEVRRVVSGLKSEAYGKQISAWVSGNYVKYTDILRRAAHLAPMARVQAMLAAIGDRPWRDVRSEHKVTGNSGSSGTKSTAQPQSNTSAVDTILRAIPLLETKQDVMRVLAALRDHLETLDGMKQLVHVA